jgi:hypothetical protein
MKTKFLSIVITLVIYTTAFGQDYAFKVLVNKGKNEIKSGANWEPVKVGTSLKSADELKVTDNAYVGLIHVSGKPLEVKSAGKYKVVDLSAKVGTGASVLNKYTDFILSSATQKKGNLSATGAVHRGVDNIQIYLPRSSSYVYSDTVSIEWEKDKAMGPPYVVTFTSLFGDELHKVETSDNSVSINLNDAVFANENDIMVKVTSKKDKKDSEIHTLRKFSKAEKEKVRTAFSEIQAQTAGKTALNSLIQAGFFEQNKLLADASSAYQKAIKLEPGVQAYQEAYEAFLLRTGLKVPRPVKK